MDEDVPTSPKCIVQDAQEVQATSNSQVVALNPSPEPSRALQTFTTTLQPLGEAFNHDFVKLVENLPQAVSVENMQLTLLQ